MSGVPPTYSELLEELFYESECSVLFHMFLALLDVRSRDEKGDTVLHLAAKTKNLGKLKMVASKVDEQDRGVINIFNHEGYHCLHAAIPTAPLENIKFLIGWGQIDINVKNTLTGDTPLHRAVKYCRNDVVKYILNECPQVDPTICNHAFLTVYEMALAYHNWAAAWMIVTHVAGTELSYLGAIKQLHRSTDNK